MPDLPPDLLPLAKSLLKASSTGSLTEIKSLLKEGAPAWYQDEDLGWSCLHYAAERYQPELLTTLLRGGGVWNAVDKWGRTAGEICLSLGDQEGWEIIRNEGVRSEMLHHALSAPSGSGSGSSSGSGSGAGSKLNGDGNHVTLRAEDTSSAGDNLAFLKSELRWEVGEDGKERVLDADGNRVMMGWEEPLMRDHVKYMTQDHPGIQPSGEGLNILNIGYGLGIVDRLFRSSHPEKPPRNHVIIEAHPQVLAHMREQGVYTWPGVKILEGRWQDWLLDPDRLGQVLEEVGVGGGFDMIFVDTFAEGYEDLKAFFEVLPDILEAEHGVFSFWNGLGATNPTIYSVSSNLAELHLDDVGMDVTWYDVTIPESQREEVWKGVRRAYWELPGYRLPVARMKAL